MADGIISGARILPIPSNGFFAFGSICHIQEGPGHIEIVEKESRSSPVRIEYKFGGV